MKLNKREPDIEIDAKREFAVKFSGTRFMTKEDLNFKNMFSTTHLLSE